MNREIKFRAWWAASQQMYKVSGIEFDGQNITSAELVDADGQSHLTEDALLMQFTGLFDRLKVGIYEDDIVRVENTSVGVIEYSGAEFIIRTDKDRIGLNDMAPEYVEIIGNIYESPELLKAS